MNYCTYCRARRMTGRFCGNCSEEYAVVPGAVLVDEAEDTEDEDDDYQGAPPSSSGGGGGFVIAVIVVGLILLALYGWSRPKIDETSAAYIQGQQIAATYIDSGQPIDKLKTPGEVCDVRTEADATEQDKVNAANNEAGCQASFKAHLNAQG